MRFVHLDIWLPNCPNPQITIWAKFGVLRCDLGCNLGHNLSHNLGMIWATVNAPNVALIFMSLSSWQARELYVD